MSLRDAIIKQIRTEGPLSFAAYMELALYHPELGYYACTKRRSGHKGDFFTSVDIGSVFGELLSKQFAQMCKLLSLDANGNLKKFDLVEAGSGSGHLTKDILDQAEVSYQDFYKLVRCTLLDRSPSARLSHAETLKHHNVKLDRSGVELTSSSIQGVIFANELLDAMPVHSIVMTEEGLREVYVDVDGENLVERLGVACQEVQTYLRRHNIRLDPGWRGEVSPVAVNWVENAGRCLKQGFLVLVDYGYEAAELYSKNHTSGTLASYQHHRLEIRTDRKTETPLWLTEPGSCDITAHVDLTAIQQAAERVGLQTLGILDQTYFLLGLASEDSWYKESYTDIDALKRRLGLKTLLMPGSLGSTHKVMIFGRNVGTPKLDGFSFATRMT